MLYGCRITGTQPIIMHNGAGIDPLLPINQEKKAITSKRGANRTAADDARLRELETLTSLWLDKNNKPTIPTAAIRANIEKGARKRKQGPMVREGLVVVSSTFEYDEEKYGIALEELQNTVQFTVPVVIQKARLMRTRAKFDLPWWCVFELDCDDELVDFDKLMDWLDIGGRRIGLGDWRPEKSGNFGRYLVSTLKEIDSLKGD